MAASVELGRRKTDANHQQGRRSPESPTPGEPGTRRRTIAVPLPGDQPGLSRIRSTRQPQHRRSSRTRTLFASVVKKVARAAALGIKTGEEVVVPEDQLVAELVCNGPFIDALYRLKPALLKTASRDLFSFVSYALDTENKIGDQLLEEVERDDDDEQELWKESAIYRKAMEMVLHEKLASTLHQEVEIFWREKYGQQWPKRTSRKWEEPISLPSAGDHMPFEREGPAAARDNEPRLVRYSLELGWHRRQCRRLTARADAWIAQNCPKSKIGSQLTRELTTKLARQRSPGSQSAGCMSASGRVLPSKTKSAKSPAGFQAGCQGGAMVVKTPSAARTPSASFSAPTLSSARPRRGYPPGDIDTDLQAPESPLATRTRIDTKFNWATSRFRPLTWKPLSPMPCKEAPPAPARWLFEAGRTSSPVGLASPLWQAGWSEDSFLGQLEEWPPKLPAEKIIRRSTSQSALVPAGPRTPLPSLHARGGLASPVKAPATATGRNGDAKTPGTPKMLQMEEERAATPNRAACCPTKQALHASASGGALPELPRFSSQRFPSVAAKVRDLGCGDRVALSAKGLQAGSVQDAGIEEVDLGGNLKLNESQLEELMASLCNPGASVDLRKLSLRRCVGVGMGTLANIIELLSTKDATPKLRDLDLSGVQIGLKSHKPLCAAIKEHVALKDVRLSDAALGSGIDVKGCIGELLASTSIRMLDLSWNCFTADVFTSLGENLTNNQTLRSLSLSNCSATSDTAAGSDVVTPAAFFIEHLSTEQNLQRLDLSLNRIDFRAALCLEDAMESNSALTQLDISHNPLGVDGLRSALRMLTRDGSGLNRLSCDGVGKGYSMPDEYPWEPANPAARYHLDFERPQDRALLRMILKLCRRLGTQADACMLNPDPPKYKPPDSTDSTGLWVVPKQGKVSFTFSVARALEGCLGGAGNWQGDVASWLKVQAEMLRPILNSRRELLLIAFWRQCNGMFDRQMLTLDAISKDFLVNYGQLLAICQDEGDHSATIIHNLLPCLRGGLFTRHLAMVRGMHNLPSCVALFRRSAQLLTFNCEHPTGHYKLDLENSCDRSVAQRLMLLDSWETLINIQLGRPDTSQRGNRSHFRNEKHVNFPILAQARNESNPRLPSSLAEWNLPASGVLELDYASSQRPAREALSISKEAFDCILLVLCQTSTSAATKLSCLRQIADQVFLRAMQLREMMGIFKDEASRAELFVIFCLRVTDVQNRKLVITRMENPKVLNQMYLRIGHAAHFPFLQPEQAFFELDLSYYDQRVCINMFCNYSFRERRENMRDVTYMLPDGTLDKLEHGVPKSWETLAKVPTSGVVKGRYICAPENRKFQMRMESMEMYGYWKCTGLNEKDVWWWYTLADAPMDIIHLISFIMSQWSVKSPSEVYPIIVKDKPYLVLSLFEEAFVKRFGKDGDLVRLKEVFRYFDGTGDGRVSDKEWGVLDLLWAEIRLSIQEFAQFLERTFQGNDANAAWEFFDTDEGGTVTEQEWKEAVMSLGYFGPLNTIFVFLDPTGLGHVRKQAFVYLMNFSKGMHSFNAHLE